MDLFGEDVSSEEDEDEVQNLKYYHRGKYFNICLSSLRGRRFLGGGLGRVQPSESEASARKFERGEK